MGFFKAFTLGLLTAYGVYFITRKGPDGRSVLDDLIEKPDEFLKAAKGQLLTDAAGVVKDIVR